MKIILTFCMLMIVLVVDAQSIFNKQSVKAIMDKVNKYQFENPWKEFDDNWIRGTYYTGVMACYQATGDKKYLDQCNAFGNNLKWQIPSLKIDSKASGANLLTCSQTWLECYLIGKKDEAKIKPTIDHLNNPDIKNPISGPLDWYYENDRKYVDALFTGPPALAMLYSITKDEKYLRWMESFVWDVYGELFDNEKNLFHRDNRFFPDCLELRTNNPEWKGNHQVTAAGKKVIWSRGNGWAIAGIARVLKYLPKDHPSRNRYILVFKNMAYALKQSQSEEGYWSTNLADPNDFPGKETSGTSFFIYGLTWGINNGILSRDEFLPVVEKGWKSIYNSISEEGKIQWGQRVGDRPVLVKQEDSHEYISGTFLLAASEIYKLK